MISTWWVAFAGFVGAIMGWFACCLCSVSRCADCELGIRDYPDSK